MMVSPVYRLVIFAAKMMFREIFDGEIHGDDNIPRTGPCIVACNHLSYFDPPFIGGAISSRTVYSIARSSLFRSPFRSWLFRNLNCIPLDRETGDIGAIKAVFNLLKQQQCIMIYPEGTRSADGTPGEPKLGVGLIACKAKAPVIPCRIFGTFEIMDRKRKFFDWNQKATIVFGKPLMAEDYTGSELSSLREQYKHATETIMSSIYDLSLPK